jgi:hypothetical protein
MQQQANGTSVVKNVIGNIKMGVKAYYSCGCRKYWPDWYIKAQADGNLKSNREWKKEVSSCYHKTGKAGKWLLISFESEPGQSPSVNTNSISRYDHYDNDFYQCIVCNDWFILDDLEAEISEPKICSNKCAAKWSH